MKKLLILSIFKDCDVWVEDILTLMYKVILYNDSLSPNDNKKLDISFSFLDGNSCDSTYSIIENFCRERGLNVQIRRFESDECHRFKKLANIRNYLLEESLSSISIGDDDYILIADSDVKFAVNMLHELIKEMNSCNADILAPMIFIQNFREYGNSYFYDTLAYRSEDGKLFNHFRPYLEELNFNKPNKVGSVGSFYMIKSKVGKNIRYNGDNGSEQIGFCNEARSKGYEIYVTTRLSVYHINYELYNKNWH